MAKSASTNELKALPIKRELKKEVSAWLGTPYRYGGDSRSGVDCSGFVHAIFLSVYDIQLPRTSKEIYRACTAVDIKKIREGDLVFFNYTGKGVSHVGIYLGNGKYVHASTQKGVVISDLNNAYTRKNFIGCGRIR